MDMNPACPKENKPVKPFSKFIETATTAKMALFCKIEISIPAPVLFASNANNNATAITATAREQTYFVDFFI